MVIGFIAGHFCSRFFHKKNDSVGELRSRRVIFFVCSLLVE